MSKVLAVFGATGQQGSSVIANVLADPELSKEYKIRAITRDVKTEKLKHLHDKVEIVQADVTDPASVDKALEGAHTTFLMTTPSFTENAVEDEFKTGKSLADSAVKQGLKYIIFSTLPPVAKITQGKYTTVTPFDAKGKIEGYIRTLPIQSAFVSLANFMENFEKVPFLAPRKSEEEGIWVLARHVSPKTGFPLIDAIGDSGKFVTAVLAEPEKFAGQILHAAEAVYTFEEIAAAFSKATGEKVVYRQLPREEYRKTIPFAPDLWLDAFTYDEEYGYFGPGTEELVAKTLEHARGRLTTFDEYLEKHPFKLEQ